MLIIGNLRQSIIVLKKTITKNEYGAESIVWIEFMNLKADVKYNNGTKVVNEKEIFNNVNLLFTTHYRSITNDMRILFKNQKYLINMIEEIGYKDGLIIHSELINE